MRKTTIALIMLLSVTAVFAQEKKLNDGMSVIYDFTDFSNGDTPQKKPVTKKPATKKPVTKPTTRKTKIDNAGDVYIGAYPEYIREYDFVAPVPVPYHGYTDSQDFPAKTKCDTVYIHDTFRVKDTVNVPIYLVDVTDTLPATVMYKKDSKSDRVYTLKGFALVRGFKVMVQNKPQWADKPQIVGALDDRKRLIKNVIQVL